MKETNFGWNIWQRRSDPGWGEGANMTSVSHFAIIFQGAVSHIYNQTVWETTET